MLAASSDGYSPKEPSELRARAPDRPLFRVALALALGSACGASGFVSREFLLAAAIALAAAWLGWRAANSSSARLRDSPPEGDGTARVPAAGAGLLTLILVLGALRSSPEPGLRWSPDVSAWQGIWRTKREGESEIRGTLASVGSETPTFELPRGCARDGEQLRILRGDAPVPRARGPDDGSADEVELDGAIPDAGVVVAHADEVIRLASPALGADGFADWRASLERRAGMLEDRGAASLARAFLLGDSSALDPATADLFTRNGLRHVLAVSGWHVAMMAWLIVRPFAALAEILATRYPRHRRALAWLSMLASLALCIAYVPLTGGGAPVRRSAIAVALASTAAFWPRKALVGRPQVTRRIDTLSLWSAALCVECWLDPSCVTDVGVQLSYAATLGLIVATRPLSHWLARGIGLDLRARPAEQLLAWPHQCALAFGRRALRATLAGVAASMAAVLATAPIVWLTFGEACPWGLVTTPLLAPLFIALFAFGMLMLAAPFALFGALFTWASQSLLAALEAVDRLPGTPALLPERPAWLLWGTLALLWLLLRQKGTVRRVGAWLRGTTALGAALIALPWAAAAEKFELHVLDVGHGTCVVFRAPGEPCWIFDCGSRDRSRVAQDALAPLLRSWDADRPKVVLSHADSDHSAGLRWVLERAPPSVWGGALTAPLAERLPHTCVRVDIAEGELRLPENAPDLTIMLLRGSDQVGNEGSRSLILDVGEESILLSGDAVDEGWSLPLRQGRLKGRSGILLAPHHGSEGGRVGAMLDALKPNEVWVSSSSTPGIAAELDRRRIPWSSTNAVGPIHWSSP